MEIPALDHDWVVVDQTFDEASNTTTVRYECSRCNSAKSEQVTAETGQAFFVGSTEFRAGVEIIASPDVESLFDEEGGIVA